jgi:hypothetical protein
MKTIQPPKEDELAIFQPLKEKPLFSRNHPTLGVVRGTVLKPSAFRNRKDVTPDAIEKHCFIAPTDESKEELLASNGKLRKRLLRSLVPVVIATMATWH